VSALRPPSARSARSILSHAAPAEADVETLSALSFLRPRSAARIYSRSAGPPTAETQIHRRKSPEIHTRTAPLPPVAAAGDVFLEKGSGATSEPPAARNA